MKSYSGIGDILTGNQIIEVEVKEPKRGEKKVMDEFYEPTIDMIAQMMPNSLKTAIETLPFDYKIGEEIDMKYLSENRYHGDITDRYQEIKRLKNEILKSRNTIKDKVETAKQIDNFKKAKAEEEAKRKAEETVK